MFFISLQLHTNPIKHQHNSNMKTKKMMTLVASLLLAAQMQAQQGDGVTQYVNPFIGTGAVDENSLMGNTFPGATMPFGMVQLSPDTHDAPNGNCPSGYSYNESRIYGFSHTHLSGTGCVDLLDVLVMPTSRSLDELTRTENFSSPFSHRNEKASVGYYCVKLDESGVQAELTATTRTGMHRYTFPAGKANNLVFDLNHSGDKERGRKKIFDAQIRLLDAYTLEGYRYLDGWQRYRKVYFYAKFNRPVKDKIFKAYHFVFRDGDWANGRNVKALLSFEPSTEPLLVKVALSPVSYENAKANMQENTGWDFDGIHAQAVKAWEKELSNVRIDGTDDQKAIFYTGLYHAYIQPNTVSDANGQFMYADYTTGQLPEGGVHYSTFSLWDTYRSCHPMYTLLKQDRIAGMVNSMLRQYDTYGYLPIWQLWGTDNYCMIGNHAIPVMVDAALKHIPGVDARKVFEAVKATSLREHMNSPWRVLEKYGYYPEDLQSQSVSITLEEAYDDACVARLAKELGRQEDYEYFLNRSRSYRNLFDPQTKFFRAKTSDGKWMEPFDPLQYGGNGGNPYTEANAWQYRWYVPQDVPYLVSLFGGKKNFEKELDRFFTYATDQNATKNGNASGFIGQYAHGNEPSHHCIYLYNWAGAEKKAQFYANKVMNEQYKNRIDGYSGNEDCGQMSSWYIFSSMGFYPVDPANGVYSIGSPQLRRVEIKLPGGKTFTIKTNRKGTDDCYVKSVKLNGRKYTRNYILHSDIMNGGTLEFTMGK